MNKKSEISSQQSALDELDRVFHEKARLGILTTIVGSRDGLSFNELKDLSGLTDGNLNRHLKVLVEAQVLSVKKIGQGRGASSHYKLTSRGRNAFERYLDALETILNLAKKKQAKSSKTGQATKSRNSDPFGDLGISPG